LLLILIINVITKKSFNRKKDYVQVHDYNLSTLGMSNSHSSINDRQATTTGTASEYGRLPSNHPILTVNILKTYTISYNILLNP